MQLPVRDGSQLHHHVLNAEFFHQLLCGLRVVCSRILANTQFAGQQKLYLFSGQELPQDRQRAEQSFKISVIVVMADKEKADRALRSPQLLAHFSSERRVVAKKSFVVESMMNC